MEARLEGAEGSESDADWMGGSEVVVVVAEEKEEEEGEKGM